MAIPWLPLAPQKPQVRRALGVGVRGHFNRLFTLMCPFGEPLLSPDRRPDAWVRDRFTPWKRSQAGKTRGVGWIFLQGPRPRRPCRGRFAARPAIRESPTDRYGCRRFLRCWRCASCRPRKAFICYGDRITPAGIRYPPAGSSSPRLPRPSPIGPGSGGVP